MSDEIADSISLSENTEVSTPDVTESVIATPIKNEAQTDQFGLPTLIDVSPLEVDGKDAQDELFINLKELPSTLDKVRITFRSGITLILNELWFNQAIRMSIITSKGQGEFAVFDPTASGFNAMKVKTPTDIL